LPRSIKSVLNQTYQDFELIVVDDGSTDSTRELVEEFQKKDSRTKYIFQENSGGPAKPINTGIKNSIFSLPYSSLNYSQRTSSSLRELA
jgi:glycosyltransferase involved in cell wall biosynthesis